MIEVLLPRGYKEGKKATDEIIVNLKRIYGEINLTTKVEGGYKDLIILTSYKPHDIDYILTKYSPNNIWYYMFDMNWGRQFYEDNKTKMQLITDKEYPGTRFVIPTGMIALSECRFPRLYPRTNRICLMESYKKERMGQYKTYLDQSVIAIDVVGNTFNSNYPHKYIKVPSVDYRDIDYLLSSYSFCLILHDKWHDKDNLPLKVAECLRNGVLPILDSAYDLKQFPSVSTPEEVRNIVNNYSDVEIRKHLINTIIWAYQNTCTIDKIARRAQLVETDWLFAEEIENVLVWGREKHKGNYWRDNLDIKDFMAALQRHVDAYNSGNMYDEETGESHLIHAACNLMFQRRIDELK